jgi:uncharacterized cupin superfamily protein
MLEVVADPRNGVPMHIHTNEDEHFIVLEGTLRIANGDTTLDAQAGTAITVSKGVPNAWCNVTDGPVRMLRIFSPGHIEGLFRETPPERAAMTLRPFQTSLAVSLLAHRCTKAFIRSLHPGLERTNR